MRRTPFLIHNIKRLGRPVWRQVLTFFLDRADGFSALFPDQPELNAGRGEFESLRDVRLAAWSGMEGCLEVSGVLTPEVREQLLRATDESEPLRLWAFELTSHGEPTLRVEDFSVGIVCPTDEELEFLRHLSIPPVLLQPVNLSPELPAGEHIVPLSSDEEEHLRRILTEPDHQE